ncbi:flagellar filament capping protein FliD [Marinospirillum insulare]|uniref:Flagellar hook-associated protein 2 n=1 Tax=Marinospirillum insulare TaxID=217169 RepID=A0ABQ5ZXH9_9GAMM|nr:flagellar filament capping protein FliD [Marinospirillum insulare]GLR63037.1 flagellar hook-associated protein 2 [Marinospirillum insulare]
MSGISFMGVGSGLPVNDIIKATLEAEAAPLKRLEHDKKFYESQISGMAQLKSRLSSMGDAMKDLQGLDKFQQLAANSSNDKLFTATADHVAGATAGNYNIEVLAEARSYRHVSGELSTTDPFSGTLTFFEKDGTTPLKDSNDDPITIDTNGKTLDEIRAAINSHEGLQGKVSANLVNTSETHARLVLNADESGEAGRFTANFSDATITKDTDLSSGEFQGLAPVAESDPGYDAYKEDLANNLDARIKIDGIEATSSTNRFENVISGVTIDVTAGASGQSESVGGLEVKRDDTAIKDNIEAFVKAYNDVIIHLNEAKKGSLYGDSTIRSIEGEMRNILYSPTEGEDADDTQKNFLALIGIEVFVDKSYDPKNPSSRNGTLEVDSAALTKALDENFDKVAHILGSSKKLDDTQPSGYAERFSDLATRLVSGGVQDGQSYKGLVQIRTEGLGKEVDRINDKVDSTNLRLELLEARLVKQFSAIDGIVAKFNSTGSFISQQMAGLPGYTK